MFASRESPKRSRGVPVCPSSPFGERMDDSEKDISRVASRRRQEAGRGLTDGGYSRWKWDVVAREGDSIRGEVT